MRNFAVGGTITCPS